MDDVSKTKDKMIDDPPPPSQQHLTQLPGIPWSYVECYWGGGGTPLYVHGPPLSSIYSQIVLGFVSHCYQHFGEGGGELGYREGVPEMHEFL